MQKNGESRFSLSFVRCLPIVAVLRRGIHNLTLGFCGRSNLRRCFASCVSLRYTMERMRISSYVHAKVLHFPRNSPWRECLSDSPSVSFADSSRGCLATGCTRGASAALPPPIHQGENVNFELRTRQRATFLPNFPQRKCQPQFTHTPRASSSQK